MGLTELADASGRLIQTLEERRHRTPDERTELVRQTIQVLAVVAYRLEPKLYMPHNTGVLRHQRRKRHRSPAHGLARRRDDARSTRCGIARRKLLSVMGRLYQEVVAMGGLEPPTPAL